METKVKITENWNDLKMKLKEKYPNLTDTDLVYSPGKEDELVSRLTVKLGKTQEEVNDIFDELQSKNKTNVSGQSGSQTNNYQGGSNQTGSSPSGSQKANQQTQNQQTDSQDSDKQQKENQNDSPKKY